MPRYRKPSDGPTYAEKVAMGRNEAEAHSQWRDNGSLRCPHGNGWCARVECRDGCTSVRSPSGESNPLRPCSRLSQV